MKKLLPILVVVAAVILVALFWRTAKSEKPTIAVVTLMSHPALDAVEREALAVLAKAGYEDGETVEILRRNANGQQNLAAGIAQELEARDPALIIAITTPMAQAVVKNSRAPVVFAAVTDPVGAGLVDSLEEGTTGVTGTSDAWPYRDQLRLIRQISPDAARLGVLFNPGEAASQYGIAEIKKYAPEFGFEVVEGSVSSTIDVFPVAQSLARRVDALFLSSDNTVIGGVAAAYRVAVEAKMPLYVGDSGTVAKGGLAAVSVGYEELGRETGRLAVRMLEGETAIPTVVARGDEIYVNTAAAAAMGVTIPAEVLEAAETVYDEIEQ